ncbi:MAG: hypothetical protein JO250_20180 [Armatimonadetes bacterium]|nr:hypothetical protein [Armatimonadota bacterium]
MSNDGTKGEEALVALLDNDALMDRLAQEAVRDALREHKRRGESVVVWQDGKVVTLAPEDIPVDESAA